MTSYDRESLAQMSNQAFTAERKRVHDAIAAVQGEEATDLRDRYRLIEAEHLRRVGMTWQTVS